MTQDLSLRSDDGLKAACLAIESAEPRPEWAAAIADTLTRVRGADVHVRQQRDFQDWLWHHNRIAAVGQGGISVEDALDDEAFRTWLAARSMEPCPATLTERLSFLSAFYSELKTRLEPFVRKTPRLKIFRVLAALYPEAMTSIGSASALQDLARAMGAPASLDAAGRHPWVRARLDEVLGPTSDDALAQARRLKLPWHLYRLGVSKEAMIDPLDQLTPLPALRRRRGLTAAGGLFPSLLATLDFIGEGKSREELLDYLQEAFPQSKRSSLGPMINSLQSEFNVVRSDGGRYALSERGEALLESQDPSELMDWLLTRILGVDWMLATLRDRGRLPARELGAAMMRANPGWTTDYQPNSIRAWLKSLGLIDYVSGHVELTDLGRRWAERIRWTPEALPAPEPEVIEAEPPLGLGESTMTVNLPSLQAILPSVQEAGTFPRELVAQLHSGLWSHRRRHFAVLTGLSGSGKTLLARAYARAITASEAGGEVLTLPVQPGWHDPGALLGYVNPLRGETYVRTPFLEFLQRAAAAPAAPYVAVLDEMNLSHPEQYMAPLLSAMETGDVIQLHQEGQYLDGVPAQIAYPANLVLIGTVNMDETTHGLSDKVLDRAFVLEFWDVDLESYPRWGRTGLAATEEALVRTVLGELMAALSPARLHFGWRIVDEVVDFVGHSRGHTDVLPPERALDHVLYAKVLPKLRGEDSPRFRKALDECVTALEQRGLQRCSTKVRELREELAHAGSARFWR